MSDKNFWETVLQLVSKPSEESLAIARQLNEVAEQVQVSDHGAVSISTSTILHDAEFAKACEAAKTAISKSH
ncbi:MULTISPECIES: hypothetical protein [Pseudomonas]|uniref:hypothetical protein n=1 Tax=Pseudomonas TaxID=286 RepID=UPI001F004A10|nr:MULTISPECIES: hypothetical protein [Pseudomonas]MCG8291881.1 hypothetical protein [Pseudomonas entomophila]